METIKLKENEILVLRTADKNGQSFNHFQWPADGLVEAPDWNGKAECGGGLHGLPRGCGDGSLLDWSDEYMGQLVAVNSTADYLEFDAKCKFKAGRVVFSKIGALREAIEILSVVYPDLPVVGRTATAGNRGTATAGDDGILVIKWYDRKRYRISIGYVGEDGIEPNKAYGLDKKGNFIAAKVEDKD